MKDFAHSAGQFRDWKGNEPKRQLLFSSLLDVVDRLVEDLGIERVLSLLLPCLIWIKTHFVQSLLAAKTCSPFVSNGAATSGSKLPTWQRSPLG
jgi:hypothetical protein